MSKYTKCLDGKRWVYTVCFTLSMGSIIDLNKFLLFYLFARRRGSLRKELGAKVKTPFDAMAELV